MIKANRFQNKLYVKTICLLHTKIANQEAKICVENNIIITTTNIIKIHHRLSCKRQHVRRTQKTKKLKKRKLEFKLSKR